MAPVDLITPGSPSLLKSLDLVSRTPYYSSYYTEYESMVSRVRLLEEEATRWRGLAEMIQQDKITLATSEGMAQANLHIVKAELEKQSQVLKSTDAQLTSVRDDLRRMFEASQRKEEQLSGEVARLKSELMSSLADNQRLKLSLEASETTSRQRAEVVNLRDAEVQELRTSLQVSKQECTRLQNELTVARGEGERLKLALEQEANTSKQRGELLIFRDTEVKQKTADLVKMRADLDMTLAHSRKVQAELATNSKTLQATGDALQLRNAEWQKMSVELSDAKSREMTTSVKAERLEQDAKFWSEAYLVALNKPTTVWPTVPIKPSISPPISTSIYRTKLLDAKAKAAAFDETLARIRAGQYGLKDAAFEEQLARIRAGIAEAVPKDSPTA